MAQWDSRQLLEGSSLLMHSFTMLIKMISRGAQAMEWILSDHIKLLVLYLVLRISPVSTNKLAHSQLLRHALPRMKATTNQLPLFLRSTRAPGQCFSFLSHSTKIWMGTRTIILRIMRQHQPQVTRAMLCLIPLMPGALTPLNAGRALFLSRLRSRRPSK